MTKKINIIQKEGQEEVPAEVIAQAIVDISKGFKKLGSTRLTRETIVLLVHEASRVNKSDVRLVLDVLDTLEQRYLKPIKK